MNITVYLLNSFGVNKTGGNPAGVVLNAESLTDTQKQYIAKKIGFSETAFVQKSEKANFKLNFFTPTDEADLCGHATIATYTLLLHKGLVRTGKEYSQELNVGLLTINIKSDHSIIMEQPLPIYSDLIPVDEITKVFPLFNNSGMIENLLPQIVSTGVRDIFVPILTRKTLFSLKPNFENMSKFNKKTNTTGFHIFTLDTIDPQSIANTRNFAPLYGINEESATGSSTGALACYLFKYKKLKNKNLANLLFEQGYAMNKPSKILASLTIENNSIKRVQIGGKASIIGKRIIKV